MANGHDTVLARFVEKHGKIVVARDLGVGKTAYLAGSFKKQKQHRRPGAGEIWNCRVVHDSHPSTFDKGCMYLWPVNKANERSEISWSVSHAKLSETGYITVERKTVKLGQDDESQTFTCNSIKEARGIGQDWPAHIKRQVKGLIRAYADANVAAPSPAAFNASLEAELRRQPEPELPPPPVVKAQRQPSSKLQRPVPITVVSVTTKQINCTSDDAPRPSILVDGQVVGLYDRHCSGSLMQFPMVVNSLTLVLSTGTELTISDRDLSVLVEVAATEEKSRSLQRTAVIRSKLPLDRGDRRELTFSEATQLEAGDILAYEYPFQWHQGIGTDEPKLTNGRVWLPRKHPRGPTAWAKLGIPPVPAASWELFLSSLEGNICADLLDHRQRVIPPKRQPKERKLNALQRQMQAIVQGKMWKGTGDGEPIWVGAMVIFQAHRKQSGVTFVVDNPGKGAIFAFPTLGQAKELAEGELTRTDARHQGYVRIEHRERWEQKLAEYLAT